MNNIETISQFIAIFCYLIYKFFFIELYIEFYSDSKNKIKIYYMLLLKKLKLPHNQEKITK